MMKMETDSEITKDKIDELLPFLPIFESCESDLIKEWKGDVFPYPDYDEAVTSFFELLNQPCWRDYDYIPEQAAKRVDDKQFIQDADISEIKTMFTYCLRGERFCDGYLGSAIKTGTVTALLKRLKTLRSIL